MYSLPTSNGIALLGAFSVEEERLKLMIKVLI